MMITPEDRDPARIRWVLLGEGAVPEPWRSRAIPLLLVPLLPGEADQLLERGSASPEVEPIEERLLRLVAAGRRTGEIADELNTTPRTIERRLSKLRRRWGARSTSELTALLAARGFSPDS